MEEYEFVLDEESKFEEVQTETVQEVVERPALTTDFADYSVTEDLLLLCFLFLLVSSLWKMIKGGFSWLNW